jgi:hypothetical protein
MPALHSADSHSYLMGWLEDEMVDELVPGATVLAAHASSTERVLEGHYMCQIVVVDIDVHREDPHVQLRPLEKHNALFLLAPFFPAPFVSILPLPRAFHAHIRREYLLFRYI